MRTQLHEATPDWRWETPLRTEYARRAALVEIDALVAVWLGIDADTLITMYRARLPITQGHDLVTWFDANERKIAGDRYTYGHGQEKKHYEQFLAYRKDEEKTPVPEGYTVPFHKVDREQEMREAHAVFQKRLTAAIERGGGSGEAGTRAERHCRRKGSRRACCSTCRPRTPSPTKVHVSPFTGSSVTRRPACSVGLSCAFVRPSPRLIPPGNSCWTGGQTTGGYRTGIRSRRSNACRRHQTRHHPSDHGYRLRKDRGLHPVRTTRRERPQSGIKAVLLYPMNALAADQADRINKLLCAHQELEGVHAGLHVIKPGMARKVYGRIWTSPRFRSPTTRCWTCPAAFLTRCGRCRPAHRRGRFNTYDGAQGTDVAMLLRRLASAVGASQPERPLRHLPVATPRPCPRRPTTMPAPAGGGGPLRDSSPGRRSGGRRPLTSSRPTRFDPDLPVPQPEEIAALPDRR